MNLNQELCRWPLLLLQLIEVATASAASAAAVAVTASIGTAGVFSVQYGSYVMAFSSCLVSFPYFKY